MDAMLFRVRASVLWVAVAVAAMGSLLLLLFEPGAVEGLLAGEMEGEALTDGTRFFLAAVGIFPVVMVAVSLLVSDRVNRWVNMIAGLVFGFFGVFAVVSHLSAGDDTAHTFLFGVAGALAFLIGGMGIAEIRHASSGAVAEPSRYHKPTTA